MEDFVYNDYASFKMENGEIIKALENSIITARFKHVYEICEYIFDLKMKEEEISNDLDDIFEYAFDYLFTAYNNLNLLKKEFFKSYSEMEKIAKTINLYLYTLDFITEFEDDPNYNENDKNKLEDFSNKVLEMIENHVDAEDGYFVMLDEMTSTMFSDYQSTLQLFYEIYLNLGLGE